MFQFIPRWVFINLRLVFEIVRYAIRKVPLFGSAEWSRKVWQKNYESRTIGMPHRRILLNQLSRYSLNEKLNILDIGGGCGLNSIICAEIYRSSTFTVLDISKSAIDLGKTFSFERNLLNVNFIHADVRFYKFPKSSYDLIYIDAVFLYLNRSETIDLIDKLRYASKQLIIIVDLSFRSRFGKTTFRTRDGYIHNFQKIMKPLPINKIEFSKLTKSGYLGRWSKIGYIIKIEV